MLNIPRYFPCPDNSYILTRLSCDFFHLCYEPVLLKLHWTDVSQCRMQSSAVVVVKPIKHFIHCLTVRFKPHSIQSAYLQRSPQAFNGSIDAPMSSNCGRIWQICKNKRIQFTNNITLQTALNFFIRHSPFCFHFFVSLTCNVTLVKKYVFTGQGQVRWAMWIESAWRYIISLSLRDIS